MKLFDDQVMRARVDDEVNSEKARVGDTFSTTLVDPVICGTALNSRSLR
jgi:hypothetical protein